MKFSTRHDTDLPAGSLFDAVTDFHAIERMLSRRGATVQRQDALSGSGVGMGWRIGFDWRGRSRDLSLEVTRLEPTELVVIEGRSEQFDIRVQMTVVAADV